MTLSTKPTNISTGVDTGRRYPIIAKHYGFAEQAAADAFGPRWIRPADRSFVDRAPVPVPAPADHQQENVDIVDALGAKWRAA